jgi:3-dehydrosphinganine reductase
MDFQGKNAIVTGGSSGIGKATARLLAQRGANVAIIARRQALLDTALAEIEGERVHRAQVFETYSADLSIWEEAQAAIAALTTGERIPDILINSAGIPGVGYFEKLAIEVFRETMEIDVLGTVYPCKLVAPMMMAQGSGHIVNISSVAGFLGVFGYTAYGSTKFAIRGFSDALRSELKPHGVCVSIVFPPDTDTPLLHEENNNKPWETARIAGTIKPLQPDQVARSIVWAIERNRYIVTPGFETSFYYAITNGIQSFARWYFDRVIARTRKELEQAP